MEALNCLMAHGNAKEARVRISSYHRQVKALRANFGNNFSLETERRMNQLEAALVASVLSSR